MALPYADLAGLSVPRLKIFDWGDYNEYMMAKRHKAFRRAALLLSAAARLWRHIFIAMSIARMIPMNHSLPNLPFGNEINRILD